MHSIMRPERPTIGSRRSTRSQSLSSDITGHGLLAPPTSINPSPAYIAVSAASQLVAAELETDEATVSPSALSYLNHFLDHILFNILRTAKSTKLSALKPAITSVLKAKLGKAALAGAEEELHEYLGDDDDEDESDGSLHDADAKRDFDLELAWKLARLRCMVYSRLGDLEEDEEDEYIESEQLDERGGRPRRFSNHPSRVTTASAIFLTSIIEYLSEQALAYAAQASQRKPPKARVTPGGSEPSIPPPSATDRIVVDESDMKYLAYDSPLQKLWRGWRHTLRPPINLTSRPISPDSPMMTTHSRKQSMVASDELAEKELGHQSVAEVLEEMDPASMALPMNEHDIDEIEVPGYCASFAWKKDSAQPFKLRRPRSLMPLFTDVRPPTPTSVDGNHDVAANEEDEPPSPSIEPPRPRFMHFRSRSLPISPVLTPLETSYDLKQNTASDDDTPEDDFQTLDSDPQEETTANVEPVFQDASSSASVERDSSDVPEPVTALPQEPVACELPADVPEGIVASKAGNTIVDLPTRREPERFEEASVNDTLVASVAQRTLDEVPPPSLEPALSSRSHTLRRPSKSPTELPIQPQPSPPALQLDNPMPEVPKPSPRSGAAHLEPVTEVRESLRPTGERNLGFSSNQDVYNTQNPYAIPPDPPEPKHRSESKLSQHTKSSSASSKKQSDRQSFVDPGVERAAVQRIYPSSSTQDNAIAPVRSNTSYNGNDKRPATGGSLTSVSRNTNSGRGSTETSTAAAKGRKSTEQDLENLIRSKETLKYTLTPQNMREIEAPDSPRYKITPADFSEYAKDSRTSSDPKQKDVKKAHAKAEVMNGLRSNPPGSMALSPTAPSYRAASQTTEMQQPPPMPLASRSPRSQYLPRDAKVERSSLRDLADFAKSTGPDGPAQLPTVVSSPAQPKRSKISSASRFQAREPVIKGPNSELIDFIREGPPRADGSHRIPRTVAPFRTTMDSDELNTLAPTHSSGGRHSESSNQDGSIVTKSTVNSRTGLMDSTNRRASNYVANTSQPSAPATKNSARDRGGPQRKQRRVRDPYAIDLDSDDEMDDAFSPPPRFEEESLIDFLRNSSPPNQNSPQPLLLSSSNKHIAAQSQPNSGKKAPPSNGLRGKIKRTASTHSVTRNGDSKSSKLSAPGQSSSRSGKPGTSSSPAQVNGSRYDTHRSTETGYAPNSDKIRQKPTNMGPDTGKDDGLSKFFSRKRRVVT